MNGYYYLDFSRLTDKLAEFIANPFSYGTIGDYIGHGWALLFYVVMIITISAMITINILVWTIPTKTKKKALKNINGDKKLYFKIWRKSGFFVVFCIMSTVSIHNMILNTMLWSLTWPFAFSVAVFPKEYVIFLAVVEFISCYSAAIIWFIVSIFLKSKADKSALNKSSHKKIVRKIRESEYKK